MTFASVTTAKEHFRFFLNAEKVRGFDSEQHFGVFQLSQTHKNHGPVARGFAVLNCFENVLELP